MLEKESAAEADVPYLNPNVRCDCLCSNLSASSRRADPAQPGRVGESAQAADELQERRAAQGRNRRRQLDVGARPSPNAQSERFADTDSACVAGVVRQPADPH